jgi:hypothetical protein
MDLYKIQVQAWDKDVEYHNTLMVVAGNIPIACEKVKDYMTRKHAVIGIEIESLELIEKDILI